MSYKPEQIHGARGHLTEKAATRAARAAKKAATRLARRAAKRDPENAPAKFRGGWID